ncbi:ATP-binding protein [bacterium]|nr:MAG: ATP-binding protein [bacterium]
MTPPSPSIRPRERDAILQALRAGVVPRAGQQHIQVARDREIRALLGDIDRIADGGSGIRFIIGDFGSGKTFFLGLVRAIALERKLVVVQADLNPDRRLQASNGQGRSLYQELMRNMTTRAKPEGGALSAVVERFVSSAVEESSGTGEAPEETILRRLASLREMVGGYDFADVIAAYWRGHESGNETLKADAVRWLRAEFSTKTDARNALGVRTIVDDANVYDMLKLIGRFVRLAGFGGLLVELDEMVNLYKLANTQARNTNYEQILRILNDCLQGGADGIGFVFGGTPEFLMDPRKGLYSYPALSSRLQENTFARDGLSDLSGPVIRLQSLTGEDLYVLLHRLRDVQALGDPKARLVPDEALQAFLAHCRDRVGDAYFRTPRNTIKGFLDFLSILEQNPGTPWESLVERIQVGQESNPDAGPEIAEDDELATLKL